MQSSIRLKNIAKMVAMVLIGVVLPFLMLIQGSFGVFAIVPLILLILNSVGISYVAYVCRAEFM